MKGFVLDSDSFRVELDFQEIRIHLHATYSNPISWNLCAHLVVYPPTSDSSTTVSKKYTCTLFVLHSLPRMFVYCD